MVYQDATGLYHFLINVIPFISNSVVVCDGKGSVAFWDNTGSVMIWEGKQ